MAEETGLCFFVIQCLVNWWSFFFRFKIRSRKFQILYIRL